MNPVILLSAATQWLQHLACRWQEARRARRDFELLSSMSAYELRDIGISHAEIATQAPSSTNCH